MSGNQPFSDRGRGTRKAGPKGSQPSGPLAPFSLGFSKTASNSESGVLSPLRLGPGLGGGTGTSSAQGPPAPFSLGLPETASNLRRANPFSDESLHPHTSPPSDSEEAAAQDPFAIKGASDLARKSLFSLFSGTGVSGAAIEEMLQDDTDLPDTPSKTDKATIEELQRQVNDAVDDAKLLKEFQQREKAVRGDKTQEQRKQELRRSAQPWIRAGLNYRGPMRPGLFLEDGTRNPERPAKRPNNRSRPGAPSGTGSTGDRGKDPKTTIKDSSSTSTGVVTKGTKGGTSKTPGKRTSSQGSQPRRHKKASTGVRPPKGLGSSPLSGPPLTRGDLGLPDLPAGTGSGSGSGSNADPPAPIPSGTGGASWQVRDDLFQVEVMDAAGITTASNDESVASLPTLPSSIDYNTENWDI